MKATYVKSTILLFFVINSAFSQVGVNTITPASTLDVIATSPTGTSTAVDGLIIPRVDRLRAQSMTSVPTSTMIYVNSIATGTATGTTANMTVVGFYFYNGTTWEKINTGTITPSWSLTGNTSTTPGTNFIGTTDAQDVVVKTANAERMRILADGRVAVNTAAPATGSLFSSVSSATNPFAVAGQSANNGSAVIGSITGGTTTFGAVQGEYLGTSEFGSGIVGFTSTNDAGTDFLGTNVAAVYGELATGNLTRSFGISGATGNNAGGRTGGVIGTEYIRAGSLGYYSNVGNSYSFYGFGSAATTGAANGNTRMANRIDTSIGLGVYGGVIGGWIKGDQYGTVTTGNRFSSYNLGKVISNEDYIVISGKENKVVSYAATALQPEINSKGVAKLTNGEAVVTFEKSFSDVIDASKPVIVTCTPMGETKGVFLAEVTANGFRIKENQNGTSDASFTWIAIGEKNISEREKISPEILDKNFESHLTQVMQDENSEGGKAIWSENGTVKFGEKAPINPAREENYKRSSRLVKQKEKKD